jgi:hypothetical protein
LPARVLHFVKATIPVTNSIFVHGPKKYLFESRKPHSGVDPTVFQFLLLSYLSFITQENNPITIKYTSLIAKNGKNVCFTRIFFVGLTPGQKKTLSTLEKWSGAGRMFIYDLKSSPFCKKIS